MFQSYRLYTVQQKIKFCIISHDTIWNRFWFRPRTATSETLDQDAENRRTLKATRYNSDNIAYTYNVNFSNHFNELLAINGDIEEPQEETPNIINEKTTRQLSTMKRSKNSERISDNKLRITRERWEGKIRIDKQGFGKLNAELQYESRKDRQA